MFARGVFSFHPARLPTYPENPLSPIIPTYARAGGPGTNQYDQMGCPTLGVRGWVLGFSLLRFELLAINIPFSVTPVTLSPQNRPSTTQYC